MTLMIMPLTYSIAYGLIAGIVSYMIMEGTFYLLTFVGIAKPEFLPPADGEVVVVPATEDQDGTKDDSKENSEDEDPSGKTMRTEDEPPKVIADDVEQMEEGVEEETA
jgi:AGZA family xanthine/uracil permease-like MFS transporter